MRPSNISDDFASTESVIEHCCNWLSENEGYTPDNIFLLQPTSPIRKEGSIDMSFELFLEEKADSLLSVNRFHHFLWEDKKNPNALYNYKKRPRRQDIDEVDIKFIENGSIYITKYNAFMRDLNRLSGSISLFEMHDEEAYEIDTPLDFIIVESILKYYYLRLKMLIERNIKKYVVNEKESLMNTLEKINSNKKRIVFVVSNHGNLLGSFSDGDLRRSITNNKNLDLNKSVSSFMNLNYKYENISNIKNVSKDIFTKGIDAIPLVDNSNRLSAIIFNRDDGFVIGDKNISETSSCFIIAEIGNNHNGDINLAKRLVDLAIESGADYAKFQMRNTEALYKNQILVTVLQI